MSLEAREMPEVRRKMLNYFSSDFGEHMIDSYYHHKGGTSPSFPDPDEDTYQQLKQIRDITWKEADLFHVNEDMSFLADAAGATLPGFTLTGDDTPAPVGVCYFERPVHVTHDGMRTSLLTWQAVIHPETGHLGIYIEEYAEFPVRQLTWTPKPGAVLPPFILVFDTTLWGGDVDELHVEATKQEVQDMQKGGNINGHVILTLIATWMLMKQEVATVEHEPLSRHQKRQATHGNRSASAVRVITLRRTSHAAGGRDADSGRRHVHRWVVKGHWRNQWYPSQKRHVPIWITPYVKGPDDAPFLTGEKVYELSR